MSKMPLPKRVRLKEQDWPSAEETEHELSELLYSGKPPFKTWAPTQDLAQVVKIAQDLANKRNLTFEVVWRNLVLGKHVIKEWEAKFHRLNEKASRRGDYNKAVTSYWAKAKNSPAMAVCRCILNIMDGVQENEYFVMPRVK